MVYYHYYYHTSDVDCSCEFICSFGCFVNQLTLYGFHRFSDDVSKYCFHHPDFVRSQPERLEEIGKGPSLTKPIPIRRQTFPLAKPRRPLLAMAMPYNRKKCSSHNRHLVPFSPIDLAPFMKESTISGSR